MPRRKKEKKTKTSKPRSRGKKIHFELRRVRGMKDILPEDMVLWDQIIKKAEELVKAYAFQKIETPILELASLFDRSLGQDTDIVSKEMFTFSDKGGDLLALRPEGTAPVARAYIEHGFLNRPQPVKLYYFGPFFRHDRPQAGRFRQFHQFGLETLGESAPMADAEIIFLTSVFFKEIDLDVSIQINSIGCANCRTSYLKALKEYYQPRKKYLCETCKKRYTKNTLRLLDCKEPDCRELSLDAPHIIDYLDEDCRKHFTKVLEYLDEAEVAYTLNPRIVRGLDYYNRTSFEIWPSDEDNSAQNSLGGGGRYDYLIEQLGGRETPAVGVALGLERIISLLRQRKIKYHIKEEPLIFVAQLGESAKKKSLVLYERLRKEGFRLHQAFTKDSLRSQLSLADKLGAHFTLILGQKEVLDKTILLRDMSNGSQEVIDFNKIVPELKKRIEKNNRKNNNFNSYQLK
jgi:histidyl-tRNA synthetase